MARRRSDVIGEVERLTVSVPRPGGWKYRISRTTRRTCRRPFFGGMYCSISVGEEHQPDLVAVADGGEGENAGQFGGQFALALRAEPKLPEALTSTSSRMVSSRSSVNFLTNGRPARAVTFQSMVRTSSPGDVFAHLVEVHAPALEDRVVFAGQRVVDQPAGADFDAAAPFSGFPWLVRRSCECLPVQVCRAAYGTGSVSRIFANDILRGDVLGLGFVADRDAVAQHVERDS